MKNLICFLFLSLILAVSCRPPVQPDPGPFKMPYFNEVNIKLQENEIQCLLDHWYAKTYEEEGPIVFRVINDTATYNSFFSCKQGLVPQSIDFSKNSLLVGMKADLGNPIDSPVNIRKMAQNLVQDANGNYQLEVIVTGRKGSGLERGGEWFGFTSLVPKIQGEVKLEMKYEFD